MGNKYNKPVIGITMGDPAGIGPEIILKALGAQKWPEKCRIVIFGDKIAFEPLNAFLPVIPDIDFIESPDQLKSSDSGAAMVSVHPFTDSVIHGRVNAENGRAAYQALAQAVKWAEEGLIDAIVTAPIHKESFRLAGSRYLDHTDFLKAETGVSQVMTMFQTGRLRIFFATRHLAFKDIASRLSVENLMKSIRSASGYLKKFGIPAPALAVAALNPHAGDGGLMGNEEIDIIRPAIELAQRELLDVRGPVPADAVFHLAKEGLFDGVLSLYHDQGHIAAKTLDFHGTISMTLGLPFLRTSVDHGTAFDIAGKGVASEAGMIAAIDAAVQYYEFFKRK